MNVVRPLLSLHVFGHLVPLVDHEHAGFVVLFDVVAQFAIDFTDSLRTIEHHQHHIGMSNRSMGAMRSVEVDVSPALAAANAGRVDGDHRLAVHLKSNVNTVASRAGDFTYDHSVGFRERVDERALANVTASDDDKLHLRIFDLPGIWLLLWRQRVMQCFRQH